MYLCIIILFTPFNDDISDISVHKLYSFFELLVNFVWLFDQVARFERILIVCFDDFRRQPPAFLNLQ